MDANICFGSIKSWTISPTFERPIADICLLYSLYLKPTIPKFISSDAAPFAPSASLASVTNLMRNGTAPLKMKSFMSIVQIDKN